MGWVIQGEYELINIYQPVSGSPTTTQGDIIVRGASADARLAIGANATVLTSNGTTATWAAAAGGGLTIGTTTITSGTSTRLLFDAAGVVSETNGATWNATNKALTVGGATVTTSNPVLNLSQTWNAGAVTFTGIKLDVTNTASAAASLLLDLQVGGSPKFNIKKDGSVTAEGQFLAANGSNSAPSWSFSASPDVGFYNAGGAGTIYFSKNNNYWLSIGDYLDGIRLGSASPVSWGSNAGADSSRDTQLVRVSASIIGVRNGTTGGAAISMVEQTAPSAPATNGVYIYAEDNGSGKTRLMALFASGAAQQVAIEP